MTTIFWDGMVLAIDSDNKDVEERFMHPHYPSSSYKWPMRDDECWVPKNHVIATIETPSLSSYWLPVQAIQF